MGLFSKKKKDEKKVEDKSAKVSSDKEDEKRDEIKREPGKQSMKELYTEEKVDKSKKVIDDKSGKKGEVKAKKYGHAYRILIKPLVTEKVSTLGAENKYVFQVAKNVNKIEVTKAVTEVYGIKPISVNMINAKGKKVRYGRISGRRKNWKKAIVTLPEGKSINVYEGV